MLAQLAAVLVAAARPGPLAPPPLTVDGQPAAVDKDVPFVPTPEPVVEAMLSLARVGEGDVLYDLGSGDGRIVIAAARRGARAVGIEIDLGLAVASRASVERAGVGDRVSIVAEDMFQTDLSQATVVTLYLLTRANLELRPKLLALRPGTRVVSHSFGMGEWQADQVERVKQGGTERSVLLWVVPAPAAGLWRLRAGVHGEGWELELRQVFQHVEGMLAHGAERLPVSGRLDGGELRLATTGDSRSFMGTIDGRRLTLRELGTELELVGVRDDDERTAPP